MPNITVGKFYEKRGDDHLTVSTTEDRMIVKIDQYDARAAYNHWLSINFWSESAPQLINLIQKAAGIKAVEPEREYEYMVMIKRPGKNWEPWEDWSDDRAKAIQISLEGNAVAETWKTGAKFKAVGRLKAGEIEDVS